MKIGVIGGSGLDNPDILEDFKEIEIETKFGKPSDKIISGKIGNVEVFIIPRHGKKHSITPSNVNYRANIYALKGLKVDGIIATTACGSLKEEIGRGDFVIVDQFIDFTRHRSITFHEDFNEKVVHTPMAEPFDGKLRNLLIETSKELNFNVHDKGTVITIEGPRFSTKAESFMFRSWGADVINMSVAPEAILANELEIPYAAVAMSTDYDCWKEGEEVSWDEIMKVFDANVGKVKELLINSIKKLGDFNLKDYVRTVPNWPKEGVMFRDITTLISDVEAFDFVIEKFVDRCKGKEIDKILGIESRGFIFGSALANKLGVSFGIIRKPGKLPSETVSEEYELEYGVDKIEIHKDEIKEGDNVLIVDDLLATGGTALAACKLVEKLNGKVIECIFVIDLPDLNGKKKLLNSGYDVFNLIEFEGD